jgi:choline kinase
MKAVILAAGRGNRLRDVTGNRPKCLARIGSRTLIGWQLRALRHCGVHDIAVIAGYAADEVRRECAGVRDFVVNTRHDTTNSLYSLWLARHLLTNGFVVLNCDVLFHEQLLRDLLAAPAEDALLMAAAGSQVFSDEEMKVCVDRGCVAAMAKTLEPEMTHGENVGIAKFGRTGASILVDEIAGVLTDGGLREWLPKAFDRFARIRPLHVIDTRGFPWIEIDLPEDYWQACATVLPAVSRLYPPRERRRPVREPDHVAAEPAKGTPHHV